MRTWIAVALLTLLASCGGGGSGETNSAPPTILGMLFSFPAGAAPAGLPNALIYVADGSTGAAITNASVTVNGVALNYNNSPTHLEYEGAVSINPGDAITMVVTVNGQTYTVNATQPTGYPTLSMPTSGAVWGTLSTNDVSWAGGTPLDNMYYLLGALDANDPAGGSPYFQALALSANNYSIPAASLSAGDKDLIIGITTAVPIASAAANSGLIVGGFRYVPVTVNSGTTAAPRTLSYISITPANASIVNGTTVQLSATGNYSDSSTQDLTNQVTWTNLYPTVVTIDATGLVSAVGNGTAVISASLDNAAGSTSVNVYQILPLQVSSVAPPTASTGVSVYSTVSATFNQPVTPSSMLPNAISSGGFFLTQNGVPVNGTLTNNNSYDTFTFTPSASLLPNTQYVATLAGSIQNQAGSSLASSYSWNFTTENVWFKDYVSTQTAARPEAIAIGDVNGDGRNDVVITTSSSRSVNFDPANEYKVFVYLQDSTGSLSPPDKYATGGGHLCQVASVDIGDVNNDGRKDVVAGTSTCGIDVLLQAADGTLSPANHYASTDANKIRIADINKDGLLDVVGVGSWGTNSVSVWLQDNAGTLTAPVKYSVMLSGEVDLEVGDINNDGRPDIVVMSSAWTDPDMEVLTQNASGTFNLHTDYNIGATPNVSSLGIGDINGDNLIDAVVTYGTNAQSSRIGVFTQNTQATLDPEGRHLSADIPGAIAISDVTNDGRKDVIVLHHGFTSMGVYEQLADGTLQGEHLYRRPANTSFNPQSLAIGDINGDGKPDAASTDAIYGLVVNYHY